MCMCMCMRRALSLSEARCTVANARPLQGQSHPKVLRGTARLGVCTLAICWPGITPGIYGRGPRARYQAIGLRALRAPWSFHVCSEVPPGPGTVPGCSQASDAEAHETIKGVAPLSTSASLRVRPPTRVT